MDSNHGRRPYESHVAPCVVTVAGTGVEPAVTWVMSPVCKPFHSPAMETRPAIEAGTTELQSAFAPCVRVIEQMRVIETLPSRWQRDARPSSYTCKERILGIEPSAAQLGRLAPHHEDIREWPSLLAPHVAGAFTTAGARVRNRTEPASLQRGARPSCCAGKSEWRCSVTLRIGFFAGEASSLLRPSRGRSGWYRASAVWIWNPTCSFCSDLSAPRTRIELVSFLRQRNCDTSRITKRGALGASRTRMRLLRRQRARSAGKSVEGTPRIELGLVEPQSTVQTTTLGTRFVVGMA